MIDHLFMYQPKLYVSLCHLCEGFFVQFKLKPESHRELCFSYCHRVYHCFVQTLFNIDHIWCHPALYFFVDYCCNFPSIFTLTLRDAPLIQPPENSKNRNWPNKVTKISTIIHLIMNTEQRGEKDKF